MRQPNDANRRLLALPLSEPLVLAALIAIGMGQAIAVAAAAFASSSLLTSSGSGGSPGALVWLAVLIGATLGGALLRGRERVEAEVLGQRVVDRLRCRMFEHLLGVAPGYLRSRRRGATIVRFFGDLQALRRWVSLGVARLVVSGTTLTGCAAALIWLDPVLAGVVGAVLAIYGLVVVSLAGVLVSRNRSVRRRRGQLANFVTEQVTAQEITRLHCRQRGETRRLARRSRRLGDALINRARGLGTLDAATYGATALLPTVFIAVPRFTSGGPIDPAGIVAMLVVVALLAPSLRDLARAFEYRQAATVALDRLDAFFAWPAANKGRRRASMRNPEGVIEIRDVWLSDRAPSFSARIESGEHVALSGANGTGKSTLLALTAGLLEPRHGTISIGGQKLERITPRSLHRHVALVSLDLPLVRGSLRRNLLYHSASREDANFDRIIDACGLATLVAQLDYGLNTQITEAGRNLSQGERQRIALARALLAKPSVLLLDEVDAHLDPDNRQILERAIRTFDGIVLAATHDPALRSAFDRSIEITTQGQTQRARDAHRPPLASVSR